MNTIMNDFRRFDWFIDTNVLVLLTFITYYFINFKIPLRLKRCFISEVKKGFLLKYIALKITELFVSTFFLRLPRPLFYIDLQASFVFRSMVQP